MTPFYTAKGDLGDTGYLGVGRLSKASLRIEAVGAVDEASAALGLARAFTEDELSHKIILKVQKKLYELMTDLSAAPDVAEKFDKIKAADVQALEADIETIESLVALPREFIVAGESLASAALAVARTVVRRAERRAVALLEEKEIQKPILVTYLNRLSSLIFILEIYELSLLEIEPRLAKEE